MKKSLTIILVIVAIVSTTYWHFYSDTNQSGSEHEPAIETLESATVSNLSFSYITSPDGLILINNYQNWPEDLISTASLFGKRDYKWFSKPGFIGEGPPSITISAFKNPEHLNPQAWAVTNSLISNIELIENSPTNTEVGGANGVYYVVLGLYFL